MAEKEDKKAAKAEKTPAADKAPNPKAERAAKAKADAAAKAAAPKGEREPDAEGAGASAAALRAGRAREAHRAVQLQERHAGAAHRQDRAQHGRRRGASPTRKKVESAAADLALIAGQKAVITHARKSIATFKLRERHADRRQGHAAQGAHVRVPRPAGEHRAAARARLPRPQPEELRRARQLRASGIKEHIVFPEINYDKVDQIWGMDIIVCTTAKTDDEARALLDGIQLPVPAVSGRP